ncbi:Gfo/Idh/MocA family protein [Paracoccus kondratievae]
MIDITAPNALHKEMALAAISAGKHVYCEKPLAPLASDARQMADAAAAKGVKTQVGFNYLCNPMLRLAREMIAAGELGEIRGYRGLHAEDYMADADGPGPSATIRRVAARWPISAAMRWPRRNSCSARSPR